MDNPTQSTFEGYGQGKLYDEMFASDGSARLHAAPLMVRFNQFDPADYRARKEICELCFLRQGTPFYVYHDDQGTERIFPLDPVPRVMPSEEWEHLEAGLTDHQVGVQASHASAEVCLPGAGWIGFDPTNNNLADERYVKVAVGRDYDDVAPVEGTYHGSGHCHLEVVVQVEKLS